MNKLTTALQITILSIIVVLSLSKANAITSEPTITVSGISLIQYIRIAQERNYTAAIRNTRDFIPIQSCADVKKLIQGMPTQSIYIKTMIDDTTENRLTCNLYEHDQVTTFTILKI